LIGLISYSQGKVENFNSDEPKFKFKVATEYHNDNVIIFEESVSFNSNTIAINDADKIIFDRNTNKIIVFGLKKFKIDGVIKIENDKSSQKKGILEYTIGEKIAYLR